MDNKVHYIFFSASAADSQVMWKKQSKKRGGQQQHPLLMTVEVMVWYGNRENVLMAM